MFFLLGACSRGTPGEQPVTWTGDTCTYVPTDADLNTSNVIGRVPGCPIPLSRNMVRDARFFPLPDADVSICQSDLSFDEASETGILGEMRVGSAGIHEESAACRDRSTQEVVYTEFRAIQPSETDDPYAGFGEAWYVLTPDGTVDWVYILLSGAERVDCSGFGSYGAVMFGTPFFTPEPRYIDCD